MTSYRVRNLGVAAGLALAAVILVVAYLSNYKRHVQSGEEYASVYVASNPIPAGTPAADLLNSHLIHKTTVLQRNLVPGFVDDPAKLSNLFITRPLFTNEQVTLDSFGRANARGIQGQLAGTDRAIQVSGTAEQLLAGTVRTGDHVDVVASWGIGANGDVAVSRTILRDILVVKAPEFGTKASISTGGNGSSGAYSAILKLSDTAARQWYWMIINGKWTLSLRSPVQASNGKDDYDNSEKLLLPALPAALRKAVLKGQADYLKALAAKQGGSQ
jgi:Flp pilus assembly protein CpaB